MAIAVKALSPLTQVFGVETELYPSLDGALRGVEVKCGGDSLAELRRNYDSYTASLGRRWSELGRSVPGPES